MLRKKITYVRAVFLNNLKKKIESQVSQLQFKSPATTAACSPVHCVQLQPQPTHEMYIKKSRNKISSELKNKKEDSI